MTAELERIARNIWAQECEEKDYVAALAYLTIRMDEGAAKHAVKALRKAEVVTRRANDILRACRLTALPLSDPGVSGKLRRLLDGNQLRPVLVVTPDFDDTADIADGYHRVSLAYQLDPFLPVQLKIGVYDE